MNTSAARIVAGFLLAAIGSYAGIALARYAEADDAPGGVVIGGLLMLGAIVLGAAVALRGASKPKAE